VALITVRFGWTDAKIFVAVDALGMKCLGSISGPMAGGALGAGRPDTEIIMASDALPVERILSAWHHIIAHSTLVAHGAVLRSAFVALLVVMMTIVAVQSVFLGMDIVIEHTLLAQCGG